MVSAQRALDVRLSDVRNVTLGYACTLSNVGSESLEDVRDAIYEWCLLRELWM